MKCTIVNASFVVGAALMLVAVVVGHRAWRDRLPGVPFRRITVDPLWLFRASLYTEQGNRVRVVAATFAAMAIGVLLLCAGVLFLWNRTELCWFTP